MTTLPAGTPVFIAARFLRTAAGDAETVFVEINGHAIQVPRSDVLAIDSERLIQHAALQAGGAR